MAPSSNIYANYARMQPVSVLSSLFLLILPALSLAVYSDDLDDAPCDFDTESPTLSSHYHRLEVAANMTREALNTSVCRRTSFEGETLDVLHDIAWAAIKCPERSWTRYVASKWQASWDKLYRKNSFDMRSDSDRFYAYIQNRKTGVLADLSEYLLLEHGLVEDYREVEEYDVVRDKELTFMS